MEQILDLPQRQVPMPSAASNRDPGRANQMAPPAIVPGSIFGAATGTLPEPSGLRYALCTATTLSSGWPVVAERYTPQADRRWSEPEPHLPLDHVRRHTELLRQIVISRVFSEKV